MANNAYEETLGDSEEEAKIVGTISRRVSCDGESSSHPAASRAPLGEAAQRLSLPTVSLPVSRPERNENCRANVLIVAPTVSQPTSQTFACPHRAFVCEGSPPCYLCSVLDPPPKYRRHKANGWQRLKERLKQFSAYNVNPPQRTSRVQQDAHSVIFTINDGHQMHIPAPLYSEVVSTHGAATDHRVSQERVNPTFDSRDSSEDGVADIDNSSVLRCPSPVGSYGYMHPMTNSTVIPQHNIVSFPPQDTFYHPQVTRCKKRLIYHLIYSLLLATAFSTLIVSYDQQPVIVIISVISFLTLAVFLPIISIVECLLRYKQIPDFCNNVQDIMANRPALNFINM